MELKDKIAKIIIRYATTYPDLADPILIDIIADEILFEIENKYSKAFIDDATISPKKGQAFGRHAQMEFKF